MRSNGHSQDFLDEQGSHADGIYLQLCFIFMSIHSFDRFDSVYFASFHYFDLTALAKFDPSAKFPQTRSFDCF